MVVSLPRIESAPNKCQPLLFSAINAEAQLTSPHPQALHRTKLKKLLQGDEMLVFISVLIVKHPTIGSQVSSSQPKDTLWEKKKKKKKAIFNVRLIPEIDRLK